MLLYFDHMRHNNGYLVTYTDLVQGLDKINLVLQLGTG